MTEDNKIPVVFDTDPGIDDAMALIFLAACKRLSLQAVTTVFGNASLAQCTNNALYLCERFNLNVPVHAGADQTITGATENDYPDFVHGADGLANLNVSPKIRQQADTSAQQSLIVSAEEFPGELVIIAVGRMTNIANAIQASPTFASNVKEVVIMGGAVNVRGNVTEWAEANIIGDPEAAGVLFDSGISVTQLGLDVTMKTIMRQDYIESLVKRCGDAGKLLGEITPYYLNFYRSRTGENGFACHDSSAVAFVENPDIYETLTGTLRVVLTGEQRGRTEFDANEQGKHTLATAVDDATFLATYAQYLNDAYG